MKYKINKVTSYFTTKSLTNQLHERFFNSLKHPLFPELRPLFKLYKWGRKF